MMGEATDIQEISDTKEAEAKLGSPPTTGLLSALRWLELNGTINGGGVLEMLYSSVPFLNGLDVLTEWEITNGNNEFFECTKTLHGLTASISTGLPLEVEEFYRDALTRHTKENLFACKADVKTVSDLGPLDLARYVKEPEGMWLWRCHIDIEEASLKTSPALWDLVTGWLERIDAAIFSAAHFIVSCLPVPDAIVPHLIEHHRAKEKGPILEEIDKILAGSPTLLAKYRIVLF